MDVNGDGILDRVQYMEALRLGKVEMGLFGEFFDLYSFKYDESNVIRVSFLMK